MKQQPGLKFSSRIVPTDTTAYRDRKTEAGQNWGGGESGDKVEEDCKGRNRGGYSPLVLGAQTEEDVSTGRGAGCSYFM
jgi:hypothetical protein